MTLGVMAEASAQSYMTLPPETTSCSAPPVNPTQEHTRQNQIAPMDLDSERAEGTYPAEKVGGPKDKMKDKRKSPSLSWICLFLGSDSFLPLQAEVTHNETADPTLNFYLPENSEPHSAVGSGVETQTDPSVESELSSPERFRSEKPERHKTVSPALHESFSHLVTSWCHPQDSVLTASPPLKTDVEQTALILSNLNLCDEMPALSMSQSEGAERPGASLQFEDICANRLESVCSELQSGVRVSHQVLV